MRTKALLIAAAFLVCAPGWAGRLEDRLRASWNDAWVLVRTAFESNCDGLYTDFNVDTGRKKKSGGGSFGRFLQDMAELQSEMEGGPPPASPAPNVSHAFSPGELGRVYKAKVTKAGVELLVDVRGPVLVPYQRGPFTFYQQRACKVQLQLGVPRPTVKAAQKTGDPAALDGALARIAERHDRVEEAESSPAWNGRERDEFPEGYLETLHEYAAWRNRSIDETRAASLELIYEFAEGYAESLDDLSSFASGSLAQGRTIEVRSCDDLITLDFSAVEHQLGWGGTDPATEGMVFLDKEAYREGQRLRLALETWIRLAECRFSVSEYLESGGES